jgi:hypothetical protein
MMTLKRLSATLIAAACIALAGAGCASPSPARPSVGAPPVAQSATTPETKLEVTYFLGHGRRRFLMQVHPDSQVSAESYVDRTLLKKTSVDAKRFREYYARVTNYVNQRRNLASAPTTATERECRAPFKIVVGASNAPQTLEGCRQDDQKDATGDFNRLVDEGEFLIYSSN